MLFKTIFGGEWDSKRGQQNKTDCWNRYAGTPTLLLQTGFHKFNFCFSAVNSLTVSWHFNIYILCILHFSFLFHCILFIFCVSCCGFRVCYTFFFPHILLCMYYDLEYRDLLERLALPCLALPCLAFSRLKN
jgi:hypothetical protein